MKATLTYEGKTVEVEISETEVQKIFNEPKKTGWERAEVGEYYRYIYISTSAEAGTRADDGRYQEGQYISSYDLASDQIRAIKLWLRIKRWAAEHCEPVDWNNFESEKWYLFYDYINAELFVGLSKTTEDAFGVHFDTKEHAA